MCPSALNCRRVFNAADVSDIMTVTGVPDVLAVTGVSDVSTLWVFFGEREEKRGGEWEGWRGTEGGEQENMECCGGVVDVHLNTEFVVLVVVAAETTVTMRRVLVPQAETCQRLCRQAPSHVRRGGEMQVEER